MINSKNYLCLILGILITLAFMSHLSLYAQEMLSAPSPVTLAAQSQGSPKHSVVLFAPQMGWTSDTVVIPGSSNLSLSGPLYGIFMMYANPSLSIGCLGHYSILDNTVENGFMFYVNYYMFADQIWQPAFGFAMDYLDTNSVLQGNIAQTMGTDSIALNTSVFAFHPTLGLSYKNDFMRLTPFVGYFSEEYGMTMVATGTGGMEGYTMDNTGAWLNYLSLGAKLELNIMRFIRLDHRFYFRMAPGERAYFTTRNRLDILVTRDIGVSLKIDYFEDPMETNQFFFIGPTFAF